jgi:hypothetical protein
MVDQADGKSEHVTAKQLQIVQTQGNIKAFVDRIINIVSLAENKPRSQSESNKPQGEDPVNSQPYGRESVS